ncbi:FHA domain-containing protein [Gimesia fumaroli]|jgi:predicted component of type VI protein secretion system|uniref:FHA domain protein n=1 Tax=Gimesia fumaroli TaxID=2527976 RepID=A0A518I880_9PLAN|nr:FHA domain-containing protein [Gimesia fumaroli]QDV49264.1 FHA domain protein [Gimesia fumaroli]
MLQLSLKVIGGRHDGKQIPIKGKKFLIGREEDCHLRPNSDMVSRHHCVFTVDEYSVRLRDFGSTNGTLVNDKRIKGEVQLSHGDKIQVGKLDFEIVISHSANAEQAASAPEAAAEAAPSGEILTGSDTVFDIPVHKPEESAAAETAPAPETPAPVAPEVYEGDTQILSAEQQQAAQQAYDQAAQQAGYPPQQYGYPPQQMQPGQQYPYPMPPQYYPQQGYPQQPMPAYPQQYQMPPQGYPQQPPQPQPEQQNEQGNSAAPELPPVTLPPPGETGLKNKE